MTTMKKIIAAAFVITIMGFSQRVSAQDYKTALGIRLSNDAAVVNNAVTFKYFMNEKMALEGLLSFSDPVALGVLLEKHETLNTPGLKWFYGAGGYFGFGSKTSFGAQGVIGLDYKFNAVPLNLSLDWKPELNIISDINFEPAAIGFSARFTFGK